MSANQPRRLIEELLPLLGPGSRVRCVGNFFSLYAFDALSSELGQVESFQFLFTRPMYLKDPFEASKEPSFALSEQERMLAGTTQEESLRNGLRQKGIAQAFARWVDGKKVVFRSVPQEAAAGNFLLVETASGEKALFNNFYGFSTSELGLSPLPPMNLPVMRMDGYFEAFSVQFENIWRQSLKLQTVSAQLRSHLYMAYQDNSPELFYAATLARVMGESEREHEAAEMPSSKLGLYSTVLWNKLFDFQRDGVVAAIAKLEKYNGCILADSVGLGKTFTALAVVAYYLKRNRDVLVLCPKKLENNWRTYLSNDKDNPLAQDRLHFDLLFHTDLARKRGHSGGRDLAKVNWGNYGLVVIDESHNFRNRPSKRGKTVNRYQFLMDEVMRCGIETKVLMLSATPVNNRFWDLRNQIALAYQDDETKINSLLALESEKGIDAIFNQAQKQFNRWSKKPMEQRTTESLLEALDFDFFAVLDSLTIARSRRQVARYYDVEAIGRFPTRNAPVNVVSKLGLYAKEDEFTFLSESLLHLSLAAYKPLSYVLPSRLEAYMKKYTQKTKKGEFTQRQREDSLVKLMQINLLKRLESSSDSFRQTLETLLAQVNGALAFLASGEKEQAAGEKAYETDGVDFSNDESVELEAELEQANLLEEGDEDAMKGPTFGKSVKVAWGDLDRRKWADDLEEDRKILEGFLDSFRKRSKGKDPKLQTLIEQIEKKLANPINPGNRKVIIFSAFADTATYIYDKIQAHFKEKHGLLAALVTGSKTRHNATKIPNQLNSILTCFSPISKSKDLVLPQVVEEIDLLVGTDCISEGQNLQDCDYLINYDIHWNPVRIVQRFGRVDRIGSRNQSITMVNFWPDGKLDDYIKLRQRVESRMISTEMTGAGENPLKAIEQDLEYRRAQLEKLREQAVDLEDLKEGVSITDLGLTDFRIDLSHLAQKHPVARFLPQGFMGVVEASERQPGVIFVLKNTDPELKTSKQNRLSPYFLTYVGLDGEILADFSQPKKILDILRHLCKDQQQANVKLYEQVAKSTRQFRKMDTFAQLLRKALQSILQVQEEKDVKSLFKSGGTTALSDKLKGTENFELVSFLILM